MVRYFCSCESQFRQNYKKSFDWIPFNRHFLDSASRLVLKMQPRDVRQFLSICRTVVADAYFSKESFVSGAISLGFNIINRFRNDVGLNISALKPAGRGVSGSLFPKWNLADTGQSFNCSLSTATASSS